MNAGKPRTESEVELCDRLRDWAEGLGFEVYPEVAGWDLVLVADKPTAFERHGAQILAGEQVGIHAKLRPSCEVIVQALPWNEDSPGPRHPFVAVPQAGQGFKTIAHRLGIGVIETDLFGRTPGWKRDELKGSIKIAGHARPRPSTVAQLKLPPVASRVIVAGCPSPRVLSEWRVKALRFLAFARGRTTFTCSDVVGFGLGKSWVDNWGEPEDWTTETRRGKTVRVRTYRLTTKTEKLPDWGYRDVAAEMLAAEAAPKEVAQ